MTKTSREPVNVDGIISAGLWRILVDPVEVKTQSDQGIEFTKQLIEQQEYLRYVGQVVSIGPLAFKDDRYKMQDGSYMPMPVKVGDWIVYGKHAGHEVFMQHGRNMVRRLRIINDDQFLCFVDDIDAMTIPLV
jgi:co-chaperonin GroES (HSP10)